VGSLERRVQELEGALPSEECPVCGHGPQVPYEIVFGDGDEDDYLEDEPEKPEFCDGCGRQLNSVIFFDDQPPTMPVPAREGHGRRDD
jgi:hypothetical protein